MHPTTVPLEKLNPTSQSGPVPYASRASRSRVTIKTKTALAQFETDPAADPAKADAPNILFIAGDSIHTDLVRMILLKHGMNVHVPAAASVSNTVLIDVPHLILLDWDAEGLDGDALLRGLRNNPDTRKVPVILMTNRSVTETLRRKLIPFNVQWILEKPIVTMSLPALIERTIKSYSAPNTTGADCRFRQCALLVECGQTASSVLWKAVK